MLMHLIGPPIKPRGVETKLFPGRRLAIFPHRPSGSRSALRTGESRPAAKKLKNGDDFLKVSPQAVHRRRRLPAHDADVGDRPIEVRSPRNAELARLQARVASRPKVQEAMTREGLLKAA
jgi:hypothetical protein